LGGTSILPKSLPLVSFLSFEKERKQRKLPLKKQAKKASNRIFS